MINEVKYSSIKQIAQEIKNGNNNYTEFENDINEMLFFNSNTEIFKDDNDDLILRITPSNDNINEYSFEKSILSFLDMSDEDAEQLTDLLSVYVDYINHYIDADDNDEYYDEIDGMIKIIEEINNILNKY